jgi:5-deoxy-glucuronate isomerase
MRYTADNLLVRPQAVPDNGLITEVTPASAGWEHLHVTVRRLEQGERWSGATASEELVHVILQGRCSVKVGEIDYASVGRRETVFDGKPYAVYLSRNTSFEIIALTDALDIATCRVAATEDHPARLIHPADCGEELRGGGNASRQIVSILPPGFDCQRIVAVEVYAPGGNWSSYPPHKHDVHRFDERGTILEADLEETYFYRFDKPGGYAYQRVYTDDSVIDGLVRAQENDVVLVPAGYHPVVTAHGYTSYYLNFLAGSAQSLANSDDPAFAWIKQDWPPLDPRLPIVKG